MEFKRITLEEISRTHFSTQDALTTFEQRFERDHKLRTAMSLTNVEHESITLLLKLANGELVQVTSNLVDFEDDFVELRGGIGIPLKAIVDVGV
jgi:hypothetical protein